MFKKLTLVLSIWDVALNPLIGFFVWPLPFSIVGPTVLYETIPAAHPWIHGVAVIGSLFFCLYLCAYSFLGWWEEPSLYAVSYPLFWQMSYLPAVVTTAVYWQYPTVFPRMITPLHANWDFFVHWKYAVWLVLSGYVVEVSGVINLYLSNRRWRIVAKRKSTFILIWTLAAVFAFSPTIIALWLFR